MNRRVANFYHDMQNAAQARWRQMKALAGRVAWVTGSSRGIGAAIARCFAEAGAAVALHGRDVAALERVQSEIIASGGRAIAVTAATTHLDQLETARQSIEQQLRPIDVLVANAGAILTRPGAAVHIAISVLPVEIGQFPRL